MKWNVREQLHNSKYLQAVSSVCLYVNSVHQFTLIYTNLVLTTEPSVALRTDGCLDVPELLPMKPLYAVWPSGDNDCVCPVCNDGNCTLNDCQCYSSSNLKPAVTTSNSQICWPNLSADSNNSHIIFFSEARVCDSFNFTTTPFITKTFVSAARFLVRGK